MGMTILQNEVAEQKAAMLLVENGPRVNCGRCGKVLLGRSLLPILKFIDPYFLSRFPETCAGRDNGRPYCSHCLPTHREPPGFMHNLTPRQAAKLGKSSS